MPATWSASRTTARCAIGDTLTEGEDINFVGVPNFAPEILRRVRLPDAMKAKKLKEALQQMAEEGVVQVFRPQDGSPALVGVVGPLQLDVLQVRLQGGVRPRGAVGRGRIRAGALDFGRRSQGAGEVRRRQRLGIADDLDGDPVFLARNQFYLDYTRERAPGIAFADVKDRHTPASERISYGLAARAPWRLPGD